MPHTRPPGSIQAAVTASTSADTILLADDTFTGQANCEVIFGGKDLIVMPAPGATPVVDCQSTWSGWSYQDGETFQATLTGVTFRNGSNPGGFGGLLSCILGSNPTITDCVFRDSQAGNGGAVYVVGASFPTFNFCDFQGNSVGAGGLGGAVYVNGATPIFNDCTFSGNSSDGGGAIALMNGSLGLTTRCTFHDNTGLLGGALYTNLSGAAINTCTFYDNESASGGGAIHVLGTHAPAVGLLFCTIAENRSTTRAAIVFDDHDGSLDLCIIANDERGAGMECANMASPRVACSIMFGNAGGNTFCGTDGGNLLFDDPLFCGTLGSNNFFLQAGSPALPTNNICTTQFGSMPEDCTTQIEGTTWGRVKSQYR